MRDVCGGPPDEEGHNKMGRGVRWRGGRGRELVQRRARTACVVWPLCLWKIRPFSGMCRDCGRSATTSLGRKHSKDPWLAASSSFLTLFWLRVAFDFLVLLGFHFVPLFRRPLLILVFLISFASLQFILSVVSQSDRAVRTRAMYTCAHVLLLTGNRRCCSCGLQGGKGE